MPPHLASSFCPYLKNKGEDDVSVDDETPSRAQWPDSLTPFRSGKLTLAEYLLHFSDAASAS